MRKLFVTICFIISPLFVLAQHTSPIDAYRSGDYALADSLYSQIPGDEAKLYRAKSLFALSRFNKSLEILSSISPEIDEDLQSEVDFTKALVFVQLRSYSEAFRVLDRISVIRSGHNIGLEAQKMISELSGFLSVKEVLEVLNSSNRLELKLTLVNKAVQIHGIQESLPLLGFMEAIGSLDARFSDLKRSILSDSTLLKKGSGLRLPSEYSYTILVAMPVFDKESPIFDITRGMYNGLMLALEQHNISSSSFKVFPIFVNTNVDSISQKELASAAILEYHPSLILGPLFSNNAKEWAEVVSVFDIPMLLPLANSSNLAPFNNNVFQLNPTFEMRGRAMASFAKKMGFDTLAVVAEEKSLGMDEALGFIDVAERNGAEINYSFIVDLKKKSYNAADYTKYLIEPDEELIDSLQYLPVEAAFFPISGQIAPTLAELILTDLEAQRSNVIILGSEEWSRTNIPSSRLSKFEIYYSTSFKPTASANGASEFEESYLQRYGYVHNDYSYLGYDLGNYVVFALKAAVNPSQIRNLLPFLSTFRGLSLDVNFAETTVNHSVKIEKLD